jgi:hypothetical protein
LLAAEVAAAAADEAHTPGRHEPLLDAPHGLPFSNNAQDDEQKNVAIDNDKQLNVVTAFALGASPMTGAGQ